MFPLKVIERIDVGHEVVHGTNVRTHRAIVPDDTDMYRSSSVVTW
ncbi:hypothetical protein EV641_10916 [Rhodococcus sp. SMB37]|nr:hypothetical protein EV641_10916 [Rhodococcus sp. SMB37]